MEGTKSNLKWALVMVGFGDYLMRYCHIAYVSCVIRSHISPLLIAPILSEIRVRKLNSAASLPHEGKKSLPHEFLHTQSLVT